MATSLIESKNAWKWALVVIALGVLSCRVIAMPATAFPPKPDAQSTDEASLIGLLPQIKKSDAQSDPLKRCIDYPDPPHVHWSKDMVAAICHHTFDPVVSIEQIKAMLDQHRAAEVSKIFAAYRNEQRSGKRPDILDMAYSHTFINSGKPARDAADAWLAQTPGDPYALTASGLQYTATAGASRGQEYVSKTPPENLIRMSKLDAKADGELRKALAIDPTLIPAIAEEVMINMREGDRAATWAWIAKGLSLYPTNYNVHYLNTLNAMQRWGGSAEELKQAKAMALHDSAGNPMLLVIAEIADIYMQECADCKKRQMQDFVSTIANAPILGDLRQAGLLAIEKHDYPLGAVYLSEVMRFSPTSELNARTHRGIAWAFMKDFEAAQLDSETVLTSKPNFQPALQLSRMIDAFRAEAKAMGNEDRQ